MLVPFQSMKQKTMILLDLLGAKGIFVGIVTVVITTESCCKICAADITIKMHMTCNLLVVLNPTLLIPWILAQLT